jgi:hypothetical protein
MALAADPVRSGNPLERFGADRIGCYPKDPEDFGHCFRVCQYSSFHTYVDCYVTKSKVQAGAVI